MALTRKEKAILDMMVEGQGMRSVLDALAELCEKYIKDEMFMLWDKKKWRIGSSDLRTVGKNLRADMF